MIMQMLDTNGDWTFDFQSNNNNVVAQNITTRLKEWKNDCFFNNDAGIDWLRRLDKNQQDGLVADIKVTIQQTDGVSQLLELTSNLDNITRKISISGKVLTKFSTTSAFSLTI
jgi:hypothetical protein